METLTLDLEEPAVDYDNQPKFTDLEGNDFELNDQGYFELAEA